MPLLKTDPTLGLSSWTRTSTSYSFAARVISALASNGWCGTITLTHVEVKESMTAEDNYTEVVHTSSNAHLI